ncbi:porin [Plesiomonas shigelloides]|uniref:porin n=1 Tax=Plesiomonas shigelloides TaxID=703 RepID=UPI000D13CABD|nr:porin [Plesiomonas shigelloides]AVQ87117.1 porin [Plesiomonas shigelloides]
MFKKSMIAATIIGSFAALPAHAYKIGTENGMNVEVYGVIAVDLNYYADTGAGYDINNESRVGFRAGKQMFDDFEVFAQIESGYVGDDGGSGKLGARDTFIGAKGSWGTARFGRMLTPLYELIDWPYSNPGLGQVFDWGGDFAGNYDRKSDTIRYDSPVMSGFSFSLATGRGNTNSTGNNWYGASAHYKVFDALTLHAGYENNNKHKISGGSDAYWDWKENSDVPGTAPEWTEFPGSPAFVVNRSTYLVGFEASLPAGFSFSGAYKSAEQKDVSDAKKWTQDSMSLVGQYWNGPVGFKLGYAQNFDYEYNGKKVDDSGDKVISGQLMAVVNDFVPYVRIGHRDIQRFELNTNTLDNASKGMFYMVGMEYGF